MGSIEDLFEVMLRTLWGAGHVLFGSIGGSVDAIFGGGGHHGGPH